MISEVKKELATIQLCEIMLEELTAYNKLMTPKEAKTLVSKLQTSAQELADRVKALVRKLYISAQNQHSYSSAIRALVWQAKLAMIEDDLTVATQILNQALLTAEEKKLTMLAQKVKEEINQLEIQQGIWKELIETDTPYERRLEQVRVAEYLETAKNIVITHEVEAYLYRVIK